MTHRHERDDVKRFDDFEFAVASGELRRNGELVELRPMVATLLELFVRAEPGRLVTREEIRERLWPATVIDFETGINTCIRQLRDALGDSAESPRYVQTVPRRGYRFLASMYVEPPGASGPAAATTESNGARGPRRLSRRRAALGTMAAIIIAGSIGWRWIRATDSARVVAVAAMDTRGTIAEDRIAARITSEMITALGASRASALNTRAWVPGMRYDSVKRTIEDRGVPTDVSFLVSGVVFEENGTIEVTMQLRHVPTGAEWWSARYARASTDADSVAAEVARHAAAAVLEATGARQRPSRPERS